jgi:hypothetical protein
MEIFHINWTVLLTIVCLLILIIRENTYFNKFMILFLLSINIFIYYSLMRSSLYKFDKFTLDGEVCNHNNYLNLNSYL